MSGPFEITLYDKTFSRVGWVNDPTELEVTVRHNLIGQARITVSADHRRRPQLVARGNRAVITYHGEHLLSGHIISRHEQGPAQVATTTVTVQDDLSLVWRLLGWPVPSATDPFGTQGVKQDTRTGAAETVAKSFVSAQLAHNTVDPITVAATAGRGTSITVSSRMDVLADVLMGAVDGAGVGLSARQVGSTILLDAYSPAVYPRALSEAAGNIISWSWADDDPKMTRAIVGGPNENTSREFRRRINTTAEAELGYTVEALVDAKNADTAAAQNTAGDQALAAAASTSGFSVELAESSTFRYGGPKGVRVGDQVTVDIGGFTRTDVLREATLRWDKTGVTVKPTIGARSDDPDRNLASFINDLARGLRQLRAR